MPKHSCTQFPFSIVCKTLNYKKKKPVFIILGFLVILKLKLQIINCHCRTCPHFFYFKYYEILVTQMMSELFDYSCSNPSFHLEPFVVLQSEYDSESKVNLPSLFYFSWTPQSLSDVGTFWEFSEDSAAVPPLTVRWRTAAGLSRLLQAALIIRQHLKLFVLQTFAVVKSAFVCPAWVTVIFSFNAKCLSALWHKGLARRCSCQKTYKKTFWWTHLLHFLCRFTTESLFSGKYV